MKKIIIVCGILIAMVSVAYYYYTHTPIYSLKKAGQAILENDQMFVEKYIDLDSVASNIVDLKLSTDPEISDNKLALGMATLMKPQLIAINKRGILKYLKEIGDRYKQTGMMPYIKEVKVLQNDGKIATVEIILQGKKNVDGKMQIGMHKTNGYWRITQWFNVDEMERFGEQNS